MQNRLEINTMVRPYIESDSTAIAAISAELGYPATPEQIMRRYEILAKVPANHHVCVAELVGRNSLVGWVHVYGVHLLESDGYAEIGGLVVLAHYRRHGIGRALMGAAEDWAATNQYPNVRLRSGMQRRDEAHLFYEKIGYFPSKQSMMFKKDMP
jgi:GNAT superfamily N-acetyltransferase